MLHYPNNRDAEVKLSGVADNDDRTCRKQDSDTPDHRFLSHKVFGDSL